MIPEVVEMDKSYVLAEVVREWVEMVLPGETALADRAVALAINSYETGDSIQVACRQVSGVVECWAHHPATQGSEGSALVRLAS